MKYNVKTDFHWTLMIKKIQKTFKNIQKIKKIL